MAKGYPAKVVALKIVLLIATRPPFLLVVLARLVQCSSCFQNTCDERDLTSWVNQKTGISEGKTPLLITGVDKFPHVPLLVAHNTMYLNVPLKCYEISGWRPSIMKAGTPWRWSQRLSRPRGLGARQSSRNGGSEARRSARRMQPGRISYVDLQHRHPISKPARGCVFSTFSFVLAISGFELFNPNSALGAL
jgi:hypothetical protein